MSGVRACQGRIRSEGGLLSLGGEEEARLLENSSESREGVKRRKRKNPEFGGGKKGGKQNPFKTGPLN